MTTQGVYNRDGEALGYLQGTRLYDLNGTLIGELRGAVIYDQHGERHWLIDRDAVLDLRGNVIGYLGERVPLHVQ